MAYNSNFKINPVRRKKGSVKLGGDDFMSIYIKTYPLNYPNILGTIHNLEIKNATVWASSILKHN